MSYDSERVKDAIAKRRMLERIDELEDENKRLREALTEWLDWVEWRVRKTDLDINDHMRRLYATHVAMCPECTDSKTSKVLEGGDV